MPATEIPLRVLPPRERGVCCELPRALPKQRVDELSALLKALADPTRLEIVAILRDSAVPVCICDLQATFDLSQPTLSHHMARLREAGLVESGREGIWCFYSLRTDLSPAIRTIVEAIG